jgi:hypothetical protein
MRKTVPPYELVRRHEVIFGDAAHFEIPSSDVEQQSCPEHSDGSAIQYAGGHLHCKGGVQFKKSEAGNSNPSIRLGKDRQDSRRSDFCVVVFDGCARVQEELRQSVVPALGDHVLR